MNSHSKSAILSRGQRLDDYKDISKMLSEFDDEQLHLFINQATPLGSGVSGSTSLLSIDGVPVFVKIIPLCDIEKESKNYRSTANLFQLPTFYQYGIGIGSTGFGAWRELEAQAITTNWVLDNESRFFPLMYHWRRLDMQQAHERPPERSQAIDDAVTYWDNSLTIRSRLEAINQASTSLVLFQEYIPQNLNSWLGGQLSQGVDIINSSLTMIESELGTAITKMNSGGLLHFDLHFDNILTDGKHLYFADFGLAISSDFDLSDTETMFYKSHANYDRSRAITQLVDWLITNICKPTVDRNTFISRCASGERVEGVSSVVASIIKEYASVAAAMNDFSQKLEKDKDTPFPDKECGQLFLELDAR
jgi:hypothetical protein